ncbi:MAG: FecR domain-containing protein [Candidatus Rokubacteria bacterium]|nr:FecR domain-containing protein [Candidatus Rokubacteria bacterium]
MRKPPRLLAAGVFAVMSAAILGVAGAESPKGAGTVTAVAGPATVTRLAATPQPLKVRDTLFSGDVVEVPKNAMARVLLGGKTTVTVRELSRLKLREEALAAGMHYTVELLSGKVRASVARMLMRPGEQVEVRTRNAVASVRGTDFIVETVERPIQTRVFGLLGVLEVWQEAEEQQARSGETGVITLSGLVGVSNRLAGTGRVEQIGANEAARVSGRRDAGRLPVSPDDLKVLFRGVTATRALPEPSGK